jgi:predicted ester cyclase
LHKATDLKFTINDIVCKENKAAVLFTFTGTNTGEMMGMKPTGKSVNVMGIDYLYFERQGNRALGYMDMETMIKQLG